jgi:hypothetical protein
MMSTADSAAEHPLVNGPGAAAIVAMAVLATMALAGKLLHDRGD